VVYLIPGAAEFLTTDAAAGGPTDIGCSSGWAVVQPCGNGGQKKSPTDAGLFVSESAALRVIRVRRLNPETLLSLSVTHQPLAGTPAAPSKMLVL
jgi:hypothetical protein